MQLVSAEATGNNHILLEARHHIVYVTHHKGPGKAGHILYFDLKFNRSIKCN